jgi:hypothetical protein
MPAPSLKQFAVAAFLSLLVGSLLSAAFLGGLFANAQLRGTDFLFTDRTESFSGAIVSGVIESCCPDTGLSLDGRGRSMHRRSTGCGLQAPVSSPSTCFSMLPERRTPA